MARTNARRNGSRALVIALTIIAAIAVVGPPGIAAPGDGSGTVLAFGQNRFGALGNTTNNATDTPNPVPAAVTLSGQIGTATTIAVGGNHSLVVTSSGQLYAFGYNWYGQLGNATNNGTLTANPTATLVTLPGQTGPVTQASGGFDHSLALTSSGQLYAFGYNIDGQLGNSIGVSATPNPTPALVTLPGLIGTISQISAGGYHSLVATSSGQLYAFGFNFYGQLGNVTNNGVMGASNPTPTLVTLPGQVGTIAEIAGGQHHSLVLTTSGQLYAFGYNWYGQLGNATGNGAGTANPTPGLMTLPGQTGSISHVAAGMDHSLAVTSSGQLYSFGLNSFGQLGRPTNSGTLTPNPTPALVTLPGQVGPITQLAGASGHSLVVTASGQLYAFGRNTFGQLGNASNNATDTPNPTPALVAFPAGTTIDTVARGSQANHSLALVSNLAIATAALPSGQVGSAYQATLQGAGGTNPLKWSATGLPAGLTFDSAGAAISGKPAAAGTSSVAVTLTDAYGTSVSRTFALTVSAAPAAPSAKEPRLSAVKQTASKWRLGSKLARLVTVATAPTRRNGLPVGTTFSFNLDQAARVSLAFRHTAQGRRVSGKCVAKKKGNAGKPRCTRTLGDGTLRVQAPTGTSRLRFEGRISASRKLKAGTYTVVIKATNTAGKVSSSRSLRFTIARG